MTFGRVRFEAPSQPDRVFPRTCGDGRLLQQDRSPSLMRGRPFVRKTIRVRWPSGLRFDVAQPDQFGASCTILPPTIVMRALMLLRVKPKDVTKLREYLESHRDKDSGAYATKPGDKPSMSGVYYCVIVSKWLDEMEDAKK